MPGPIYNEVTISNSALLKVGAQEISSFDDDTRSSNICAALFYVLRDEVQRAAPWRFCLQQIQLQIPSASKPLFNYQAAYDIPDNVLRPWQVDTNPWTEMNGQVFCDKTDGINVLAIVRNENPQSWDAQFAEALAWRLAMEIALGLVQSVPLKQEMEKGYDKAIALSRSTNAVVGTSQALVINFWAEARKYGYNRFWPINAGPPEPYGP